MTTITDTQAIAVLDKFRRPLRDLRISVTDRCNFRCTYCMPAEIFGERYEFLPRADLLSFEEIARLTRIFVSLGVIKVRLTGGEPLVRSEMDKLVAMLADIDGIGDLTMTTNAYLLPQKATALRNAGLHRLTVSLDTLDDAIFREMNGRGFGVSRVLEGIAAAEDAGFRPIKVNSVVQRGVNDHTLVDLARYFRERGHIVRFIEYMDVGNLNGWRLDDVVPAEEIVARIDAEIPLEPAESNYRGEVASRYRFKDGSGEIGVIASVTQPFCGDCTRLRLSPEGTLFTCLFGVNGTDLRTPMRDGADDAELINIIRGTWSVRTDRYSEERSSMTDELRSLRKKVEMYHIGG
ncbi:MAG: GTP 3',8-cyclase MoaA [Chloroflexi bacterium]|nr:GTP 3',8-cyclase MoaA [Chloroflexota bacterium]